MTTIKIGSVYRARARHSLLGAVLVASGIAAHAGLVVGANINISRATGYQGETAIAMDPTNTQRLFAVSNNQSGQGAVGIPVDRDRSFRFVVTDDSGLS